MKRKQWLHAAQTTKRVDGQFRDAVKVLPAKETIISFVQAGETAVQPLYLVRSESRLLLDDRNLILSQHQ